MKLNLSYTHEWNLTPAQAREIQLDLLDKVVKQDRIKKNIQYVAGVDVGFEDRGNTTRAAVAVLRFPSLTLHEYTIARCQTTFPYVPGYLSFREIPAVLLALAKVKQQPDLILCDGQGIAHPRRFGIACHLGVLTGFATIGVAKTRLIGVHSELGEGKGEYVPLIDDSETIGAVLRTRAGVKPVYVSIGHKVTLDTAIKIVMACVSKYRLPETTRWADRIASDKTGEFE